MKIVPPLVREYRYWVLLWHIGVILWNYKLGRFFPMKDSPDWVVLYMSKIPEDELYELRNEEERDMIREIISLSEDEWKLRKRKKNQNRFKH